PHSVLCRFREAATASGATRSRARPRGLQERCAEEIVPSMPNVFLRRLQAGLGFSHPLPTPNRSPTRSEVKRDDPLVRENDGIVGPKVRMEGRVVIEPPEGGPDDDRKFCTCSPESLE